MRVLTYKSISSLVHLLHNQVHHVSLPPHCSHPLSCKIVGPVRTPKQQLFKNQPCARRKKKYLGASDRLELYNLYLVQISLVLFLYHNGKKTGTTFFSFFCIFPDPPKNIKNATIQNQKYEAFFVPALSTASPTPVALLPRGSCYRQYEESSETVKVQQYAA